MLELTSKQDEFLTSLRENRTLTKLGYATGDTDNNEVSFAYEIAIKDYERAIMYFAGVKLWKNHRHTFREHKKYFCNHLRKPFSMSVVNFNNRMKQYRELLCHLPPPSSKKCHNSADAKWESLQVTDEEIRNATYDALPPDYKTHINHCSTK